MASRRVSRVVALGLVVGAVVVFVGSCGGGDDDDSSGAAPGPVTITCADESASGAAIPAPALPDGIPLPAGAVVTSDRGAGSSERVVGGSVPVGVDQVSAAYVLALAERTSVKAKLPTTGTAVDGATFVRVPIEGPSTRGELDVRDCGGTSAFVLRLISGG